MKRVDAHINFSFDSCMYKKVAMDIYSRVLKVHKRAFNNVGSKIEDRVTVILVKED